MPNAGLRGLTGPARMSTAAVEETWEALDANGWIVAETPVL